jgi:hypothetical protein
MINLLWFVPRSGSGFLDKSDQNMGGSILTLLQAIEIPSHNLQINLDLRSARACVAFLRQRRRRAYH